jgi:transposase
VPFPGWLCGERDHCKMLAIPTTKDKDAERPNRERESLSERKAESSTA